MNQDVLKQKSDVVSSVSEMTKNSHTVVVCEYRGLTVAQITDLRRTLRSVNASLNIYKNTLVKRAFADLGHNEIVEQLSGPNAILFAEDTQGAATLTKFAKKNTNLVIKCGLIEGKVYDGAQVKVIAKLPNKEGMLSMLCSVLNGPIAKLARTIQAVADSK